MRRAWAVALAAVAGLPLAFFFVLAPLFTDAPGGLAHPERLASFGLSFGMYAVAGALLGLLRPRDLAVACALAAPAAALAILYAFAESGVLVLAALYVALAAAGSASGAWLAGLRVRPEGR